MPDESNVQDGSNPTSGENDGNQTEQPTEETLSLTSAQLAQRLERAKKSAKSEAVSELLEGLGVSSADELKSQYSSLTEQLEALKQERMTEEEKRAEQAKKAEEKRQAEIDRLQSELERYKSEAEKRKAEIQQRDMFAVIRNAASAANAKRPEDVLMWARTEGAHHTSGVLNEEGQVDEKALKKLIDAASDARPDWFSQRGTTPGSPANTGAKPPNSSRDAEEAMTAFQRYVRKL
ncbi:hypothetical protein GF380_02330 [Candidatus Uhrbacteria bacterium]|nr:hypothetical protein [Candidatus Uhrbacteria bacterium]